MPTRYLCFSPASGTAPLKRRGRPKGSRNKPKLTESIDSEFEDFQIKNPMEDEIPLGSKVAKRKGEKPIGLSQRKHWVFTMNNYTDEDLEAVRKFYETVVVKGGYQAEIAPTTGTKHLQGFFSLSHRARFNSFGFRPGTHFEGMKGTIEQNVDYCSKSLSYDEEAKIRFFKNCNSKFEIEVIDENSFFKWQAEATAILRGKPHSRAIYWKYDDGNTGKSAFVKWCCVHLDAIVLTGTARDIMHGIVNYHEAHGKYPKIILVDLPRSLAKQWNSSGGLLSFPGVEMVKNGCFFSGKYKGTQVLMPIPHVMIFSNNYPNLEHLTRDRWEIREIALTEAEQQAICGEDVPKI